MRNLKKHSSSFEKKRIERFKVMEMLQKFTHIFFRFIWRLLKSLDLINVWRNL